MTDYASSLINHTTDKIERALFRISLHHREKKIGTSFDQQLSREIDALIVLLESGGKHGRI